MKKNIIFMLILLGIVFCVSYIIKRDEKTNSVSRWDSGAISLSFKEKTATLKPTETLDASKLLNLQNVTGKVKYIVNDEDVATVNQEGIITAKSGGLAILSAIDELGRTANMRITVIEEKKQDKILVEKIVLSESEKTLIIGQTYTINYQIYPSNATSKEVIYKSTNPSIATVNNGLVTAKKEGTTNISVCSNNICSDLIIKVITIKTEDYSILVNPVQNTIQVTQSVLLNISYTPRTTTRKEAKWTSSDSTIVKVENGKITGLKVGSAYITATVEGKSSKALVNVIEKKVIPTPIKPTIKNVTSITLNQSVLELTIGSTFQIQHTILPSDATNKSVVYNVANKKIISVSAKGLITALFSGVTSMNVCSVNNVCGTLVVKVVPKTISVQSVFLNFEKINLKISEEKQLRATIAPINATNKSIIWVSSNSNIVTVTNGLLKGKSAGKATITALTHNGLMAKLEVTVLPNNDVFKYGEELNGTNNYCLSGGVTSNKRYTKDDINSALTTYMDNAYEYAKIIGDIDPKRSQVLAAAYFLGFNPYCKVKYMEGFESSSITKGWDKNWTYKTGIDSVSFIKWAYYQVFEENYKNSILGKYKKESNRNGLSVSDFIDVALPGDVLVQEQQYTGKTRVAMIMSIDRYNNEVTIIHSKDDGIRIEVIDNSEKTNFTILTDMSRIFD